MIQIRGRRQGKNDSVALSVRIKDSVSDNAVSLGVNVTMMKWEYINQTLKQAAEAHKKGGTIFIDDPLTSKLWKLLRQLTVAQKEKKLTDEYLKNAIRVTFHKDDMESMLEIVEKKTETNKSSNIFVDFVSQYIKECENGERLKKKSTRKIKKSTLSSYKGFLLQLCAYQKSRKCVITFDDLSFDFYDDFKRFFIEKNYSPNTIARHVKIMKTILFAAKDMHLTTRDDFTSSKWSADIEDVDNIYIPTERLKQMADFDMSDCQAMEERVKLYAKDDTERDKIIQDLQRDKYRQKLSEARDIFVLGCLIGQRVSDYKRISRDMIETIVGDRNFLHIVQVKTGKDVYIPYTETIGKILDRYDGELPKIYNQHLNNRIKVVGLLLGWTENAGLDERRGLMKYRSDKRFCDAIMTHTARRSFATNAYKAGVPLSAIMAITGHSSEEMLKRYLKLGSKERAILAAAEFDKVKMVM